MIWFLLNSMDMVKFWVSELRPEHTSALLQLFHWKSKHSVGSLTSILRGITWVQRMTSRSQGLIVFVAGVMGVKFWQDGHDTCGCIRSCKSNMSP